MSIGPLNKYFLNQSYITDKLKQTTSGRSQQVSSEAHVVLQMISKDCRANCKQIWTVGQCNLLSGQGFSLDGEKGIMMLLEQIHCWVL